MKAQVEAQMEEKIACPQQKGEGESSKPVVQLAVRHVTYMEDVVMFMVVAAPVDLSMEACRPFKRKAKKGSWHAIL
ncbi:hypothetical protein KSP39_PZI009541 [Platanthera zijinensis]|uniref:Uncharacterized protein n=1 Tax=Platanthera zijinensis TaxID=2320716 RepID=A0AAP0BJZ8_9ASPA